MAKKNLELNWQKRLLIVSYENKEDELLIQTKKFIISNKCKINDRKLEIIYFEKLLNKKFETPKFIRGKKGIWLIGYDGEIKKDDVVDPTTRCLSKQILFMHTPYLAHRKRHQ